jgi:hypothetical protein
LLVRSFLVCIAALTAAAGTAHARQGTTPSAPAAEVSVSRPGATGLLELKPEELPPQLRLGRRVEQVRRASTIIPTLVLVANADAYLEAIALWTPTVRYPVLFDDGSFEARENIARFSRAFRPTRVVRWEYGNEASSATRPAIAHALARAWGWDPTAPSETDDPDADASAFLADLWTRLRPPGVVVTHAKDPAWPAALALAAFRGQPIAFVPSSSAPGSLSTIFSAEEADALANDIESACEGLVASSGVQWAGVGDDLDALTLCLNCPAKVWVDAADQVALSDRLGRLGTTLQPAQRWAWAGQIFGSASQSSYRAMCSLFLTPASAWLFDGYPDTKEWKEYDCAPAADALRNAGLTATLSDTPNQGAADWRSRVFVPLSADLILVTTMGNCDFFDLTTGTCRPGDLPVLRFPAAIHFTHSWSAQWPGDRGTIAGRWFERGAYAYVGSVQEPYLQSFVPTKGFALRLGSGGPWGVSARLDGGPFSKPWKIAVFGDPLAVLGETLSRVEADLPFETLDELATSFAASLREGRYLEAIHDLIILGRDDAVLRLVRAMQREKSPALTADILAAAILPAFRAGQPLGVVELYSQLPSDHAADPILLDALWLASEPLLKNRPSPTTLETLRDNLRPDQLERDATELARAWALNSNRSEALLMLQELRPTYTDPALKQALERAISAYRAR